MKNSVKKLLAILLSLVMLATILPFSVLAEDSTSDTTEETTEVDTSFVFGSSYGSYNSNTTYVQTLTGLGGKAEDDESFAFVYESDTALTGDRRWTYKLSHIEDVGTSGASKGVYFSFNIYASGNAIARVGRANGQNIFTWAPDGTVTIPQHSADPLYTTMERDRWHKIGLSFNETNGGRYNVYIDGKLASNNASAWGALGTQLFFAIEKNSTNGIVAYDDPSYAVWTTSSEMYRNTLLPNDVATAEETTLIRIDTTEKTIAAKKLFTDYSEFVSAVCESFTNESEVLFYNADMSATATSLDDAKTVVVKTTSDAYDYYTIADYEMTSIDIVGLVKVADDGANAADNWKSNIQIVDNTKVAVYSSDMRNLSCVSSGRLIEGLESTNGYTLSYVDANKNSASSASVDSGYIKASKEGSEDIYIEIVDKYNYEGLYELTNGVLDKRASTITSATGVAGKADDDTSHGFAATTYTGSTASQAEPKYYFNEDAIISTHPDGTRTYVFNMYVEGDANARIGVMNKTSAYYIMKWDGATGDFYAPASGTGTSTTSEFKLETGRWHQVAITMDKGTGGKLEIYVDGVLLEKVVTENYGWNNYTGIALGTICNSTEGMVLYDDIEIYNGFYDKDPSTVAHITSSENFAIDTENKIIYYQNMTAASELTAAALANTTASSADAFADSTLAQAATDITADTVVQLKSPDGLRFEYYTLKAYSELPAPELSITTSETVFTVSLDIASIADDYICYVATYGDTNNLISVSTISLTEAMVGNTYSRKFAFGEGGTNAKVFLWKNGISPVAYAEGDALISEE